ncbi:ankyrin repeat domain-containing protein [Dactylosporangium siamense]|uniref:Ankyrin repeat domain-containing protein n=1 Tax=Dactylosporangium siamense TaxID=685454 RepID=A0A919PT27_9ACTN|nr:ankyrin repeat domain-containing protein [Dactylosporangium siamense]GIG47933.1 hypothetical protein Dsi01nite_059740 [Dactylosporangium siamense]
MVGGPFAALDEWRLIRRYAVPAWMIAECAEARERGDWRAACEAARVTVAFDDAGPVADLLAGLAPDLLRWHLPRAMDGTAALLPRTRYVLAPEGPVTAETVVLGVRSPHWVSASQRLTLQAVRIGDISPGPVFPVPPHMWDARRAHELRALPVDESTWVNDPWKSAGWIIDAPSSRRRMRDGHELLRLTNPRLAAVELRRVAAQYGQRSWELRSSILKRRSWFSRQLLLEVAGRRNRVAVVDDEQQGAQGGRARHEEPASVEFCLHPSLLRGAVDLELVQHGRLGVADVHPLVRAALFPSSAPAPDVVAPGLAPPAPREPAVTPAGFRDGERVRVRCGPDWHWLALRGGQLEPLDHTADERRRELALQAFGGMLRGCFAAEVAWHQGGGRLPRRLAEYRRDLWRRMHHGGGRVVSSLLDEGMDPRVRDNVGRTLLHRIHQFEHADVLTRLLSAGADVNAVNHLGYTAMCEALVHGAPADLVAALSDAGAIPRLSRLDPATWPEPEPEPVPAGPLAVGLDWADVEQEARRGHDTAERPP